MRWPLSSNALMDLEFPGKHRATRWHSIGRGVLCGALLVLALVALAMMARWQQARALRHTIDELEKGGAKLSLEALQLPAPQDSNRFVVPLERLAYSFDSFQGNQVKGGDRPLVGPRAREPRWRKDSLYSYRDDAPYSWEIAEEGADDLQPEILELHAVLRDPPNAPRARADPEVIPDFVSIRKAAQALADLVILELHRHHADAAHEHLLALIRVGQTGASSPNFVEQMLRSALVGLACDVVWDALTAPGWTEAQLGEWQNELGRIRPVPDALPLCFEVERVLGRSRLRKIVREGIKPEEWNRMKAFMSRPCPPLWLLELECQGWSWSAADHTESLMLQSSTLQIELARRVRYEGLALAKRRDLEEAIRRNEEQWLWFLPFRDTFRENIGIFCRPPQLTKAITYSVRTEALRQMALTAIALKRYELRHGRVPANLEALIPSFLPAAPRDPCAPDRPLAFRPRGTNEFLLYSVGLDGVDNGGFWASGYHWRPGFDLVWLHPVLPETPAKSADSPILLDEVPLVEALRLLAAEAGKRIVFHPEIDLQQLNQRKVSYRTADIHALTALRAVVGHAGLSLIEEPWDTRIGICNR